jgi:hypothetical protein
VTFYFLLSSCTCSHPFPVLTHLQSAFFTSTLLQTSSEVFSLYILIFKWWTRWWKILWRFMCDYRRGMDWWMNLLTTYTHDSELQAITALSVISTLYKSPQHPLNLFQPAVLSSVVPWQRLLTVQFLQLLALGFYLLSLPCRIQMAWLGRPSCFQDNSSARTTQKTQSRYCCRDVFTAPLDSNRPHRKQAVSTVTLLLRTYWLPWEPVYRAVAQKRSLFTESPLSNGSIRHNTILLGDNSKHFQNVG